MKTFKDDKHVSYHEVKEHRHKIIAKMFTVLFKSRLSFADQVLVLELVKDAILNIARKRGENFLRTQKERDRQEEALKQSVS